MPPLFRQILIHLLKLDRSPAKTPRGKWVDELVEFRAQARTRHDETPSLQHHAGALFEKAWQQARGGAIKSFQAYGEAVEVPELCPYSVGQSMDQDFIPAGRADMPTLRPSTIVRRMDLADVMR